MTLRLLYLFFCQVAGPGTRPQPAAGPGPGPHSRAGPSHRLDPGDLATGQGIAEATQAGAAHFLYVSIVGVQASRIPYSRVKAAAEDLVRQAELAWSIVPATGFSWLLGRFLENLADRRIWPLPTNLPMQPVASTDFAAYVGECVAAGPGAEREGFGGPEILTPLQLAQQYQRARGIHRRILRLRLPAAAIRAAGPQTCPDGRHGKTTWAKWLEQRPADPPMS